MKQNALPCVTCITGTVQWYIYNDIVWPSPKRSQPEYNKMYNTTINPKILYSISITFSSTCPQEHSKKHFKWLVNDSNHLSISVQHISLRLCLNQACCFCIAVPLCWTTPRHALLCSPGHAGTLIHLECHLLDMLVRHRVRFSNDSKQLNKTLPALLENQLGLRSWMINQRDVKSCPAPSPAFNVSHRLPQPI